jgi:hypothetical protein
MVDDVSRALFHNPAAVQHNYAMRNVPDDSEVMGHKEIAEFELLLEFSH